MAERNFADARTTDPTRREPVSTCYPPAESFPTDVAGRDGAAQWLPRGRRMRYRSGFASLPGGGSREYRRPNQILPDRGGEGLTLQPAGLSSSPSTRTRSAPCTTAGPAGRVISDNAIGLFSPPHLGGDRPAPEDRWDRGVHLHRSSARKPVRMAYPINQPRSSNMVVIVAGGDGRLNKTESCSPQAASAHQYNMGTRGSTRWASRVVTPP